MRVFVTGAAGFIGRAVVQELINHGHQVLGLARSDASAEIITKAGGLPHRGDLEDLESLKSGARTADGVIHLAFEFDFNNMAKSTAMDRAAIEAMGEAMAGTGKPLVIASGTLFLPKGKLGTEDTEPDRNNPLSERGQSADLVCKLSKEKQIRGSVIRLSPTVHGKEDKGFIPMLINLARQKGFVTYIGDGSARWPAVHRLDAAVLFRLALEKGTAGGIYHGVAEQGVSMKDIMTLVGKHLQLPVQSKSMNEAVEAIGFFAHVIGSDNPVSSDKTQKELGWHPSQPKLLDDIEANYFSSESKSK
ncbi:unnamed protein product [Adineta steineri]|uniref:NAD-dependent epimerase/dehydratase domain-containing protein n=1 Tax=Adineta steineri TaxID=433720 RepID=A0A818I0Q1_9BILA|nr:unnamed protein product [Adineta steineri]CAF3511554.1 unnamed protein product [Adineta steineri]